MPFSNRSTHTWSKHANFVSQNTFLHIDFTMLHCFPVWQILHGAITTRCSYVWTQCSVCFLWRSDWKVSVINQLRLMLSAGLSIDNPFIYEQFGLLLHSTYSHLLEIRSNTEEIFFLLYQRIEMSWWINTGTVKIGGRHVFCVF